MSFQPGGSVHAGPAILLLAIPLWQIAVTLAFLFGLFLFGSIVWQFWNWGGVRSRPSGMSPEEFVRSKAQLLAEQCQRSTDEWRVPPELEVPMPRRVRSGRLGPRSLRAVPFIFLLALIAFITSGTKLSWWPTAILAAFFAGIAFFAGRKEKRLLQWGKPARAVVTHTNKSVLHVEYQDEAGNRIRSAVSRDSRFVPNPVLTILYDPQNPRESISYPGVRYEIATP